MANGVADRSEDFYRGSEQVRFPTFKTRQIQPISNRPKSVLDQLRPSGNGLGERDKQRQLMGVVGSGVGQSESTYDASLWMRYERPPNLYNKTFE